MPLPFGSFRPSEWIKEASRMFDCSQKDLTLIHEKTMEILGETGIRFFSPVALEILRSHGVRIDGDVAYFTEETVMDQIGLAPSSFTVHARDSRYDMTIGKGETFFAPTGGSSSIVDMNGNRRDATFHDWARLLKLYETSTDFSVNGGMLVLPSDLPPQSLSRVITFAGLTGTSKCLLSPIGTEEEVEDIMTLVRMAFNIEDPEALVRHPRVFSIINTNTPLQVDDRTAETAMVYARYGQPLIVTAAVMAGSTGPVTLAGTIALTNAEVLATIAFIQMVRPGTPVVYGTVSSTSDMRTGAFAIGSPEASICSRYAIRLAHAYGIPCRAGGALTDSKALDAQAGYESMMGLLASCLEGVDFIFHSSGDLDSISALSFEKLALDFDAIAMIRRLTGGLDLEDDRFATHLIRKVGPGGNFLTEDHTLKFCRKEPFIPLFFHRGAEAPSPLEEAVERKTGRSLKSYRRPGIPEEPLRQMTDLLRDRGIKEETLRLLLE